MGYRGQEDALRAQVAKLEAELSAVRAEGLKKREGASSVYEEPLRHQSLLMILVGAGLSLLVVVAMIDPIVGVIERLVHGGPLRITHMADVVLSVPVAVCAACAWGAYFYQRRAAGAVVEVPTVEDFAVRDPGLMTALNVLTCGLYGLYWSYRATASLRRITGRPDLMPGVDLVMFVATFGLWRAWADWRNARALDEALKDRSLETGGTVLLLWAFAFFCFVTPFFVPWTLQRGYNDLAERGVKESEPPAS